MVVDPAPAMARHLETGFGHCPGRLGIALQSHADRVHGEHEPALGEQAQDAPETGAGAVFVHQFDVEIPRTDAWRVARHLVQVDFRRRIAVQHRGLAAFLVIEHEAEREARPVRPTCHRRITAVTDKIARIGFGHRRRPIA